MENRKSSKRLRNFILEQGMKPVNLGRDYFGEKLISRFFDNDPTLDDPFVLLPEISPFAIMHFHCGCSKEEILWRD